MIIRFERNLIFIQNFEFVLNLKFKQNRSKSLMIPKFVYFQNLLLYTPMILKSKQNLMLQIS